MTAVLPPGSPALRVVKGSPTDEEVAVLAVVLASLPAPAAPGAAPGAEADARSPRGGRPWRRRRTWHLPREEAPAPPRPRPLPWTADQDAG